MPFALIGGLVAWRIWHELPAVTRVYIETVEKKHVVCTPVVNGNGKHAATVRK
jgi:hypothetical protein